MGSVPLEASLTCNRDGRCMSDDQWDKVIAAAMAPGSRVLHQEPVTISRDYIAVTEKGEITISVGGLAITKPLRDWHALATFPETFMEQRAPRCPKCGGVYFSIPRMGISHVCSPSPTSDKP